MDPPLRRARTFGRWRRRGRRRRAPQVAAGLSLLLALVALVVLVAAAAATAAEGPASGGSSSPRAGPTVLFTAVLPDFSAPDDPAIHAGGSGWAAPWSNVGAAPLAGGGEEEEESSDEGAASVNARPPAATAADEEDSLLAASTDSHGAEHDGAVMLYAGGSGGASAAALLPRDGATAAAAEPPPPAFTASNAAAFARAIELFLAPSGSNTPNDTPLAAIVTLLNVTRAAAATDEGSREGRPSPPLGAQVSASVEVRTEPRAGLAAYLSGALGSDPSLVFPTAQWGHVAVPRVQVVSEGGGSGSSVGAPPPPPPAAPPPDARAPAAGSSSSPGDGGVAALPPEPPPPPQQYAWRAGDYGACPVLCGGGVQTRAVECVAAVVTGVAGASAPAAAATAAADPSLCAGGPPPPSDARACNERPCEAIAPRASAWAGRSFLEEAFLPAEAAAAAAAGGKAGEEEGESEEPCGGSGGNATPSSSSSSSSSSAPSLLRSLAGAGTYDPSTGAWLELGPWGDCLPASPCDERQSGGGGPGRRGVRLRSSAVCRLAGGAFAANLSACGSPRALAPLLSQPCDVDDIPQPCVHEEHVWRFGEWSACASGGGSDDGGFSTRPAACVRASGSSGGVAAAVVVEPRLCGPPELTANATVRACKPPSLRRYYWRPREQGDCEPEDAGGAAAAVVAAAAAAAGASAADGGGGLLVPSVAAAVGGSAPLPQRPAASRRRGRELLARSARTPCTPPRVAWRRFDCAAVGSPPTSPPVAASLCAGEPRPSEMAAAECPLPAVCDPSGGDDADAPPPGASLAAAAAAAARAAASAAAAAGALPSGSATAPDGRTLPTSQLLLAPPADDSSAFIIPLDPTSGAAILDDAVARSSPVAADVAAAAVLRAAAASLPSPLLLLLPPPSGSSSCGQDNAPISANGTCCSPGDTLDASGACCGDGGRWRVDACGACVDAAAALATVVDATGACCGGGGRLDARGLCCPAGSRVDECGVCGGGSECALRVRLAVSLEPATGPAGGAGSSPAPDQLLRPAVEELVAAALMGGSATGGSSHDGDMQLAAVAMPSLRREQIAVVGEEVGLDDGEGGGRGSNIGSGEEQQGPGGGSRNGGGGLPVVVEVAVTPTVAARNRTAAGPTERLQVPSTARALLLLRALEGARLELDGSGTNGSTATVGHIKAILRVGECGDGVCQVDERPAPDNPTSCPADCPFPYLGACPPFLPPPPTQNNNGSDGGGGEAAPPRLPPPPPPPCHGAGACHAYLGGGVCACFRGYAGVDCGRCAFGYKRVWHNSNSSTTSGGRAWSCVSARAMLVLACARGLCAPAAAAAASLLGSASALLSRSTSAPVLVPEHPIEKQRAAVLGVVGACLAIAALGAAALYWRQRGRRARMGEAYLLQAAADGWID